MFENAVQRLDTVPEDALEFGSLLPVLYIL